jgi:hypothetical protein
MFVLLRPSG